MKKDVIFITSIINDSGKDYAKITLESWKSWCKKNDIELIFLDKIPEEYSWVPPTCLRYLVFKILDKKLGKLNYNKIAYVDSDIIIKWNAPNFFKEIKSNKFCAVRDLGNIFWIKQKIKLNSKYFPKIKLNWRDYLNSGFFIINSKNKSHRKLMDLVIKEIRENLESYKKDSSQYFVIEDQTILNYILRKYNYAINFLPRKYNLTGLDRRNLLNNFKFINSGEIWHFNLEKKEEKFNQIKETWNMINYLY